MLSEYITHIVRSMVACDIVSPRNLAEIMQIDEQGFRELFGRPAVSDKLQLRHVEALTRFFGCRLFDTGFLSTVGETSSSWRRDHKAPPSLLVQLSQTADKMLLGGNEDYGENSDCCASAVAEARDYLEMIDRCMGMAFVVGMADGDSAEELEQAEDKLEEAVA